MSINFLHQQSPVKWPNSTKLAQLLCHIERKYAKFVGPEEFVQCSANLIKEPTDYDVPSTSGSAPGVQDSKKTCNLENYFEWSSRLRLFVANEILQVNMLFNCFKFPIQYNTIRINNASHVNINNKISQCFNVSSAPIMNMSAIIKLNYGVVQRNIVCWWETTIVQHRF